LAEQRKRAPARNRSATSQPSQRSGAAATSAGRGEFVQSLERGLAVIRAFGPGRTHLTLSDVAQATGLTRAAARRFLLTLVEIGYVRNDGRTFSLRPRVLELGWSYLSGLSLAEIARPFMDELVAAAGESSSLAVLDGDDIVYVAHVAPARLTTINVPLGGRDPAYPTALGRVLLADKADEELDDYLARVRLEPFTASTLTDPAEVRDALRIVRKQSFALVENEIEDGLVAVAVPVHDATGAVVAAMNIATLSARVGPEALERVHLPALRDSVERIEGELAATGAPAGPAT
jgi:IclR family pca regulon transcriptional regulator